MTFDRHLLDDIRDALPIESMAARYTSLRKAGSEFAGLSPFNAEKTPSFYAVPRKKKFFDFSSGHSGDVIELVRLAEGISFREAVERCASEAGVRLPAGHQKAAPDPRAAEQKAIREREHEARRAQEAAKDAESKLDTRARAYDLWRAAGSIGGTLADAYLRSRGIDFGAKFSTLRFHGDLAHHHPETGAVTWWPGLLAAVQSPDGRFLAIWRVYLDQEGNKAPVPRPKLGLGSYTEQGGAVWLGKPGPVAHVTEGIETALGVHGILGQSESVQASLSTSGMQNFTPPIGCERTLIWPDGDTDRIRENRKGEEEFKQAPGERAAQYLLNRLRSEGRKVNIQPFTKNGLDFCDLYVRANDREKNHW